jgi:hypothetical protein
MGFSVTELAVAAGMLAVWHPPTAADVVAQTATAVAEAAARKAGVADMASTAEQGASGRGRGRRSSKAARLEDKGEAPLPMGEAAALAGALAALHPWLTWEAPRQQPSSGFGGGLGGAGTDTEPAGGQSGLAAARAALSALQRSVPAAALEGNTAALLALTSTASTYGVAVPPEAARVSARRGSGHRRGRARIP